MSVGCFWLLVRQISLEVSLLRCLPATCCIDSGPQAYTSLRQRRNVLPERSGIRYAEEYLEALYP